MSKKDPGFKAREQTCYAANLLRKKMKFSPKIAIELGSGLGYVADQVKKRAKGLCNKEGSKNEMPYQVFSYQELNLPKVSMDGHAGELIVTKNCAILSGRNHTYEGHKKNAHVAVIGVRLLALVGCKDFFLTSASGSVSDNIEPGEAVIITDDISTVDNSPLTMPYEEGCLFLDSPFPNLEQIYSTELLKELDKASINRLGRKLKKVRLGVVINRRGYEKPAEVQLAQSLGCQIVGISIVPQAEALAAMPKHLNLRIAGISAVTNSHCLKEETGHGKVVAEADKIAQQTIAPLLLQLIDNLCLQNQERIAVK